MQLLRLRVGGRGKGEEEEKKKKKIDKEARVTFRSRLMHGFERRMDGLMDRWMDRWMDGRLLE